MATQIRPSAASAMAAIAVAAQAVRVLRVVAEVGEAPRLRVEAIEAAAVGPEPEPASRSSKIVVTPLALRLCASGRIVPVLTRTSGPARTGAARRRRSRSRGRPVVVEQRHHLVAVQAVRALRLVAVRRHLAVSRSIT